MSYEVREEPKDGDSKPYLSPSSFGMYGKCGEQYRRRYIEGHKIPPGMKMIAGTGAHASAALDLFRKSQGQELLSVEEVRDISRDAFKVEWEKGEVSLTPEEKSAGLKAVFSQGQDLSMMFGEGHHKHFAPIINPIGDRIEWKARAKTDLAHDLLGVTDRIEIVKVGSKRTPRRRTRDLKTTSSKKKPSPDAARDDEQNLIYTILSTVCDNEPTTMCAVDTLRAETRKSDGGIEIVPYVSTYDIQNHDYDAFWEKFARVSDAITKGVFIPAKPGRDWWCSEKWCGYAATCPFFAGRVSAAVPGEVEAD